MRKKVLCIVSVILLCGTTIGGMLSAQPLSTGEKPAPLNVFTHTVFAEYGSTTGCGPCVYAHQALDAIYYNGWFPFYYIALVSDKNTHAYDILWDDFNVHVVPTILFDGGFEVDVGAGSMQQAMNVYNQSIASCGARPVPDIFTELSVVWMDDAMMSIDVSVQNNDSTPYVGRLRVFVTEIVSPRWHDAGMHPYSFAFLDYAFDEPLSVAASGTVDKYTIWNGFDHNDGHGNAFGDIDPENILVVAAVFNATRHQGYAYPPNGSPFDAYYVDETTGVLVQQVQSEPPEQPLIAGPANGVPLEDYDFSVMATDPEGDDVYYLMDWGDGSPEQWTGPYSSGDHVVFDHFWVEAGTYEVRARVKDCYGAQGGWSDSCSIEILSSVLQVTLQTGFGINLIVKNTGEDEVSDIAYELGFDGGIILIPTGGQKTGVIDSLAAGEQTTVKIFIFGLGWTSMTTVVRAEGVVPATSVVSALLLGPFVFPS